MSDPRPGKASIETFIDRARRLTDEDRQRLAGARAASDETFRAGAWKAATEILAQHGRSYHDAWVRIGPAFVPERLEKLVQDGTDRAEITRWQEIARLARMGMDDALLALTAADIIRPPDLRELYRPWKAMLERADRRTDSS
jgi:hypothetical protein